MGVAAALSAMAAEPDWKAVEEETLRHFQAILRMDTQNPPGRETQVVEYLKKALDAEGIPNRIFALEPDRANLVARLKGNGRKRPLLLMAHTDVVRVALAKWKHPPFSATREGGHIYGRGAVDDKDNVAAALMTMLLLKRTQGSARPRCYLSGGSGRRGQCPRRHRVHGEPALERD